MTIFFSILDIYHAGVYIYLVSIKGDKKCVIVTIRTVNVKIANVAITVSVEKTANAVALIVKKRTKRQQSRQKKKNIAAARNDLKKRRIFSAFLVAVLAKSCIINMIEKTLEEK